ncbi:MAG: Signal peptidase I (EC [uncultured Sulfurovum sp.]|uniref:Signal peptidase I n=1 Tax=uncultured Sulfurovum sp. TaxID=269237 RepID=A0A6S6T5Z1_9BACT|nr:MAG: Signal peptidase I (EC [uncultured Sulfurovum sp.]
MKFLNKLYRFSSTWTGTIIIVLFLIFFVIQSFVIPSGSMKRTLQIGDFLFAKKFSYGTPIPVLPWLQIPLLPDFNNNGHLIEGDKPKREDIVIFLYPKDEKTHFVKRCVATGGDEIVYQDKHLYVHFIEGDDYIKENYKAEKIKEFRGKLWVDNPYMDKYKGIQYDPERNSAFANLANLPNDMNPIYVKELGKAMYQSNTGTKMNAFYKKVEKDHYYMVGDNRDNSADSRFWGSVSYKLVIGQPWFIYFSWDTEKKSIRWDRLGTFIDDLQLEKPRY